jgi:hypothetical protein
MSRTINKIATDYRIPVGILKKGLSKRYFEARVDNMTKFMNRAQLKTIIFNATGKMPGWYVPGWILRKKARGLV